MKRLPIQILVVQRVRLSDFHVSRLFNRTARLSGILATVPLRLPSAEAQRTVDPRCSSIHEFLGMKKGAALREVSVPHFCDWRSMSAGAGHAES